MQEIINKRTRNSKYFDIGNNQIQAVITQYDQHYHDGINWQDIDTNWETEIGFGRKIKKAKYNLRIHTQGTEKTLRFGFAKGVFIDYTIPNIQGNYSGSVCTFVNSWSNTDLVYTVTPKGIKNDIVLKTTIHPSSFSFPIQITGCIARLEANSLVFYVNENQIGKIPVPYMEDANGKIGSVRLDYDGTNVRFVPDPIWMAGAVYPITIDPTTTIQPDATAGKDAYIRQDTGTSNYGSSTSLQIGKRTSGYVLRSLLQFVMPGILTGTTITNATLSAYTTENPWLATILNLHKITNTWTETGVTWNNAPAFDATILASLNLSATGVANTWLNWNITTLVQGWVDGLIVNNGVLIKASDETVANWLSNIWSSDYVADITLRPKLTVTYTEGGTDATVNAVTATTNISAISPFVSGSANINSTIATINTNATIPVVLGNALIQTIVATSSMDAIAPTISSEVQIISTSAQTQLEIQSPIVSAEANIQTIVANTVLQFINPTITAIMNIFKKSSSYKIKELLQNYIIQEQKERYKIKELPEKYSWKELK